MGFEVMCVQIESEGEHPIRVEYSQPSFNELFEVGGAQILLTKLLRIAKAWIKFGSICFVRDHRDLIARDVLSESTSFSFLGPEEVEKNKAMTREL